MKIEDIIIERDHHHHHHHHLPAASATTIETSTSTGVTTPTTTIKRSSSLAINAPSSKNHKNETTCTKMSDENNSISATAIAIKNGLNGATINTSSSSLTSSSSVLTAASSSSSSSTSGGGITIVAAVTDSRIHVSRANPIHSNSNHHHHSTSNNNGTTSTTTTTTISNRHGGGITKIKLEPVENNGTGADYSTCKSLVGGAVAGTEVVGRIPTSSSAAAGTGSGDSGRSVQGIGGRLQFFKDGKFILELARAKEGEKSGWVSVPRKQFRSPSATSSTVTPTYPKNESSTSLSFSDDNSSIQSSPWQRDHCWKQSTPRRGISKEMCFHFKRTKHILVSPNGLKSARIKRRRPLDNSLCQTPFRLLKNGCSIAADVEVKSEENLSPDDDATTAAMEEEKSSDGSSTEKEGSVRESSKTPTPESQSDTVDAPSKAEEAKTKANESTRKTTPRTMNGEKRLKSRAKLTTIIQKLIDRLPTGLFHLSKTQIIGGATQQQHAHSHSHHQAHSSHHIPSTSSRLTSELHYHQQHVSPRKRILREFEKVSLEDTPAINSKRIRAKGNSPAAAVGTLPLTPIPTSRGVVVPSSSSNYVTNGNRTETVSSNNSNMTPNSTPTRLYSSYSIHSLLGGNNNTSSSNNSANNSRIKVEHSVNQSGGGCNDPSYLRAMLASPKSPESCTNSKLSYSSSVSGSAKKRSPPYSPLSEIHHQHHSRNRSPNVDATYGNMRSPPEAHSNRSYGNNGGGAQGSASRVTPPHGYLSSPKNSSNSSSVDSYKLKSENLANSSPNHHFYSPYMLSPKYVPPPSPISPNNLLASDNYHPKLKGARSPSQQNLRAGVFRTHSPHATQNHSGIPRESSPIALQSSPSPGGGSGGGGMNTSSSSSTPRTVPKKTVSIRRQFASPSSSSPSPGLSEHSKNAGSSNSSNNSIGKGEERTAMSPDNRRTPTQDSAAVAAAAAAAAAASKYHQHANAAAAAAAAMMQRSSPLGGGASSLYYMYPPPNGSPSPHHSSSSPSPSPSSSYIPQINPYYNPYVSTLAVLRNPLWMHHYPAAAAAAAAAAGAAAAASGPVPQQAVPFFPYNGAAATTPSHLHHSSFAPMHLAAAGQLGLQPPPPPPASLNRSPPTTDDTISPSSIKEEHSSDVPLNLSKH